MPTPFEIDFHHKSLASTFATCISCFDYALREGTNDWLKLRLSVVRLRLTRWGEAVKVYSDPNLGQTTPDPDDIKSAKGVLVDIIATFESLAHGTEEEPTADLPPNQTTYLGQLLMILEGIASGRSKGASLLTRSPLACGQWSAKLVTACSERIPLLYEYFPASKIQRELRYDERRKIEPREALAVLKRAEVGIEEDNDEVVSGISNIVVHAVVGNTKNASRHNKRMFFFLEYSSHAH